MLVIDKRRARLQIMVAQQLLRRERHMVFIRHVAVKIRQRQLHRLNGQVQGLH